LFSWFRSDGQRRQVREDRKYLEARVRRFLQSYLSADSSRKQRYYEVVAGAAAACQPTIRDPQLENPRLAQVTAEAAIRVVKLRDKQHLDADHLQSMITDSYAVVAIAHLRAAAYYTADTEMRKLGTAAVHLVTMATSYIQNAEHSEV
jgi:hypothetical protein